MTARRRIYDITVPLSPALPVYPGDPTVEVRAVMRQKRGDAANVSRITLSAHSGTHLDAPWHFFEAGTTVDALDPDVLLGPALVYEVATTTHITAADLRRLDLRGVQRVLFKTGNGKLWERVGFQSEYVALTASAARLLVESGVRLVGIDYLSVDAFEREDFPVHRILLGAQVLILEGLDLRAVPPGAYELLALPLRLQGGDGAPTRAFLIQHIAS
jgi:arylformamidase